MTLCPIALMAGCRKCPAFKVCPVKGVIGDYEREEDPGAEHPTVNEDRDNERNE